MAVGERDRVAIHGWLFFGHESCLVSTADQIRPQIGCQGPSGNVNNSPEVGPACGSLEMIAHLGPLRDQVVLFGSKSERKFPDVPRGSH